MNRPTPPWPSDPNQPDSGWSGVPSQPPSSAGWGVPPPATAGASATTGPTGRADGSSGVGRRRRVAAAVVAIAGIVAGVAVWAVTSARYDRAVESLARAPVGCDTTLDFDRSGEYLLFVETRGTFPDVAGDCGRSGAFEVPDGRPPVVDVQLVDPDGDPVELSTRRGRASYDRAGFRGVSFAAVTIDQPGDHVVRIESGSATEFAIAVGEDPSAGVGGWRALAIAVMVLGVVAALVVASTGRRGPTPPAEAGLALGGIPVPAWGAPPASGPPPMRSPHGPPVGPAGGPPASPPPTGTPPSDIAGPRWTPSDGWAPPGASSDDARGDQ